MKMHSRISQQNGFTLIEILISVGLMASMFLMMNVSMNDLTSARNQILQTSEKNHASEVVFARFFSDFNSAFLADRLFQGADNPQTTGFIGTAESVNFSTFSGLHYIEDKRDTEQHQVGYFLKEKNESNMLMRRSTDYLLPEIDEGGQSFPVMDGIESMLFEYYDSNKKNWLTEWNTNSVAYAGRLPETVRVTLVVLEPNSGDEDKKDQDRKTRYIWMFPLALYVQKITF